MMSIEKMMQFLFAMHTVEHKYNEYIFSLNLYFPSKKQSNIIVK